MYIVVLFVESNEIQHVPFVWFKKNEETTSDEDVGLCWFPRSKYETQGHQKYFKSDQIKKMISECQEPNDTDGNWYDVVKKSGLFSNEIKARKMAKAFSDLSDDNNDDNNYSSINDDISTLRQKRKKKRPKIYSPSSTPINVMVVDSQSPKTNVKSSRDILDISSQYIYDLPPPPKSFLCNEVKNTVSVAASIPESSSKENNKIVNSSFKIPRQSEEYVENEQTSPIIITVPNNAKCIDENKKTSIFDDLINNNEDEFDSLMSEDFRSVEFTMDDEPPSLLTPLSDNNFNTELKNLNAFKNGLDEIKKTMKKRDEIMMTHIIMMNSTIVKLCSNFDMIKKKIDFIADACRGRKSNSFLLPQVPAPFLNTLPIKSIASLETIESLLIDGDLASNHFELLKEYICLHAGSDSYSCSHAIRKSLDLCFDKQILNLFSYHGRSKKTFKTLQIFKVIKEALSGLVNTVQDQIKFTQVVENYLKHAKPSPLEPSSSAVIIT